MMRGDQAQTRRCGGEHEWSDELSAEGVQAVLLEGVMTFELMGHVEPREGKDTTAMVRAAARNHAMSTCS